MNAERFKLLAQAYGADLDRWPAGEREAAVAFLARDAGARVWLADAASLDALLDAHRLPPTSLVLRQQIIASAPRAEQPLWRRSGAWMSGAGLAAALVLGVLAGASVPDAYLGDSTNEAAIEGVTAFDGTAYFDALETEG